MALVHETDNAGKTMELVDIEGYRLPTFWKTAEEIKGIFENIPNFCCDDDSLMLCSYPKTGEQTNDVRHRCKTISTLTHW